MKQVPKNALYYWLAITLLVTASLIAIYLRNGQAGLDLFIQQCCSTCSSMTR
jgi:hypothetical protein